MGLFGFGKKKHQSKEALEAAAGENEEAVDAAENVDEAQEVVALPEPSAEYEGRGDEHGPWDVEDENVPVWRLRHSRHRRRSDCGMTFVPT